MGFSPKNFNYVSGQPYIEIITIYKSDIDFLLGKPPIRIKSVKYIDPSYSIIDDKIKPCSIIPFKKK